MTNLRSRTLAALFIIAASVLSATAQKTEKVSEAERSVRAFYDTYAEDLLQGRRAGIVDRYDPRGAYLMGNGSKRLQTFEEIKDVYMNKWSPPKEFSWRDLSVEVISKDAAAVMAKFEWTNAAGQTRNYSYTGVLIRRNGKWRIRIEDESAAPPKPTGN